MMRTQIMDNISNHRNTVYFNNRKTKEEVLNKIQQLKENRQSLERAEQETARLKKLSLIQEQQDARLNHSLELFTIRSNARKDYDDKIK